MLRIDAVGIAKALLYPKGLPDQRMLLHQLASIVCFWVNLAMFSDFVEKGALGGLRPPTKKKLI